MIRWLDPVLPLLLTCLWPALAFAADGAAGPSGALENVPPWATGAGVIIGMLGGPCFAIWYAWYMTTNRIPAIEKAHVEQLTEARKQHSEQVNLLIVNYRQDIKVMWDVKREDEKNIALLRREDDNKLTTALDRLADRMEDGGCRFEKSGGLNAGK